MTADPRSVLLTPAQLAERWKQSRRTIYNKISSGTIGVAVIRIGGTEPRFRLSDVIAFEEKSTIYPEGWKQ
jgi:hypothetical protein